MPNWSTQRIYADSDVIEDIVKKYYTNSDFDFNKIIHMPKELEDIECSSKANNGLILYTHDLKDAIKRHTIYTKLKGGKYDEDVINQDYMNILNKVRIDPNPAEEQEMRKLGKQVADALLKYGYTSWYDWSVVNWGTKWNATGTITSKTASRYNWIQFDTAWSPAEPIHKELSRLYPNDPFDIEWLDESQQFGGHTSLCNGERTYYEEFEKGESELEEIINRFNIGN